MGEMTKAGISVPPGFVILADAFEKFLAESDLGVEIGTILKTVKSDNINTVEKASEKIRDLIMDAQIPKDIREEILKAHERLASSVEVIHELPLQSREMLVAVRSSATAEDSEIASWAGELESYLNISKKDLIDRVKKCWSSLFTPRAIFYRWEKNLQDHKVSVAVVVQKMIQAEVSGICFTVHPVTEDRSQMVIEAGWGLGEAIVGGMITPDTYVINKFKVQSSKLKVEKIFLDKNIAEQEIMIKYKNNKTAKARVSLKLRSRQKLPDENINQLAKICLDIEKHYGSPQDIEWAFAKEKFFIIQSRPITTLS